jgi:hypothetical protein
VQKSVFNTQNRPYPFTTYPFTAVQTIIDYHYQ